jgi:hypothetical protein
MRAARTNRSSASAAPPVQATAHSAVTGGMPGWQITPIALGAALIAAVIAVLLDRTRTARRLAPPCSVIPRGRTGRSGPFLARQPEASEDLDRWLEHMLTRARDASDQRPPSSSIAAGPWPVDAACRARGYRLASVIAAFIAAALGATTPDAAPEVLTQAAQARAGLISIQVWAALSPLRRHPYPRRPGLAGTRG